MKKVSNSIKKSISKNKPALCYADVIFQTGKKVTGFTFGKYSTTSTDSTANYSAQVAAARTSLQEAIDEAKDSAGYMMTTDFVELKLSY